MSQRVNMNSSTSPHENNTQAYTLPVSSPEVVNDDVTDDPSITVHVHLYELIGSIGMLDNSLVILVILLSKNMRQKVCNILILHQSLVDFLGSLFLVVNSPLLANSKVPPPGLAGHVYCRVWANSYLLWTTFIVSIGKLIMITIDRFVEIVHPFVYKGRCTRNKALFMILMVWIICAFLEFVLYGYWSTWSESTCVLNQNFPSQAVQKACGVLIFCLFEVMPLLVMTFCYTSMLRAMRQVHPSLQSMSVAEKNRQMRQDRIRRNLIQTLLTVVVAYFLCVSWNQMYFLLINLGLPLPFDSPFYHFSVYALFTNCIINPFIYTSKYREFQIAVKTLFRDLSGRLVKQEITTDNVSQNDAVKPVD